MPAMLLADLGAQVIKVERTDADSQFGLGEKPSELLNRGRQSIALDLKTEAGRSVMFAMAADADALIEGFRPGVMERLGPFECLTIVSEDQVAELTLTRPDLLNRFDATLHEEFPLALRQIHRDPEIRAIVLASTGALWAPSPVNCGHSLRSAPVEDAR
jgi:hypothetical protein